jgi:hypothetical protein
VAAWRDMNRIHLAIGAVCVIAAIGFFVFLETHQSPDAQRLSVINNFADADCSMDFYVEPTERFSVRKGERHDHTYKSPRIGFVLMRCEADGRTLESPGHFRLIDGGLAEVTLKPDGEIDVRYEGAGR